MAFAYNVTTHAVKHVWFTLAIRDFLDIEIQKQKVYSTPN